MILKMHRPILKSTRFAIVFLIFTYCISFSFAQTSTPTQVMNNVVCSPVTYNQSLEESAKDIAIDSNGDIVLCGSFGPSLDIDHLIYKTDSQGTIIWTKKIDESVYEGSIHVAIDGSNNIIIAGFIMSDIRLFKFDTNGTLLWSTTYDSGEVDYPRGLAVDPAGEIYVVSQYWVGADFASDVLLLKFTSAGTLAWPKLYSPTIDQIPRGIIADPLGGSIIVTTEPASGTDDILTTKFSTIDGSVIWETPFNYGTGIDPQGIDVDSAGNIYVAGSTCCFMPEWHIVKYNPSGTMEWNVIHNSDLSLWPGNVISVDSNGNSYISGIDHSGPNLDIRTVKYDSSGIMIWNEIFDSGMGLHEYYVSSDVSPADETNFYVLGNASFTQWSDWFLYQYNNGGPCLVSATPTVSPTFSMTPSWTPTQTSTQTFTVSPTHTPTYSWTLTPTVSPTPTWTPTWSSTSSVTLSSTSTLTPTVSPTPTWTATWSSTLSVTTTSTSTFTFTMTNTEISTLTNSPSFTATFTPTPVHTFTPTYTATPRPPGVKDVFAYPNPSIAKGINAKVTFTALGPFTEIRMYTLSGDLLTTLRSETGSDLSWNLRGADGSLVSGGLYLWVAKGPFGQTKMGRLAILK